MLEPILALHFRGLISFLIIRRFQYLLFFLIISLPAIGEETPPAPGPLSEVIPALFGQPVLSYKGEQKAALESALVEALRLINEQGLTAKRVNEIGNAVEPLVIEALETVGFKADRPTAVSGKQRSAGYPDLEASREGFSFYLEIKTYNPKTENSSQRTFYLSPSDDPKVTRPAFHLLLGFAIEQSESERYFAKSARLVDISELPVRLKIEYNANNRDLYQRTPSILKVNAASAAP